MCWGGGEGTNYQELLKMETRIQSTLRRNLWGREAVRMVEG